MKKVLIALTALVVLVVVALLAAPFFIPVETYKTQIAEAAKEATGRELTIQGDMRLSLLPRLELEAEDVSFANTPGAAQADMARLKKLLVQLQIFPLLTGEVRVDSFVLVEPVIHLEVDKNGRPNWRFAEADAPAAGTGGKASAPSSGGPDDLPEISLGDVRLENGLVTYSDARTGQTTELSAINMTVSLPDMDSPVAVDGSLVWNGQKLSLNAKSDALRGLMAGEVTSISLGLESEVVTLTYQGNVSNAAPPSIDGGIDLDVPSIRALAAWTGSPIEMDGNGLGPLKIKGKIAATPGIVAFTEAKIALDDINAEGDFTADISAGKPYLKGSLDVDRIDLNVYAPQPVKTEEGVATTSSGGESQKAAPADWSDEPIDLTALKAVNVDFALSVGEILAQDVKIGRSALTMALKGGLLVLNLSELNLYDGFGKGKVTVDARGKVPAVEESFTLEAIQAQPLLRDAAGFDRLEGTGAFNVSIVAKGSTEREMVQSLNGTGAFKFLDGAVRGLNLAAMVRNVGTAFMDKSARETQKTDFAELSGTFKINSGILRNDDLILRNPLLRVTGSGTADAPKRTVNYRIEPKVVGSLEGQGAADDASGITVPVIVEGTWDNVTYRPDLTGMITDIAKDPAKALEGAKDTLKQLKGGTGGLLGGENSDDAAPDPSKVLKKLFGD